MREHAARWAPVAVYMALIFYESSQPAVPRLVAFVWDKLLHGAGYAVLALLCVHALTNRFRAVTTGRAALAAWAMTVLYGATDEWHQSFVPTRQMDGGDLLADAVGAAAMVSACLWWSRWRARRL